LQKLTTNTVRQILFALFVVSLSIGVWVVLSPFFTSIVWACTLAYVSWPAYIWLSNKLGGRDTVAACLMTLIIAAAAITPLLWLFTALKVEIGIASTALSSKIANGTLLLPKFIADLPIVGSDISTWFSNSLANPTELKSEIHNLLLNADQKLIDVIGGIGRNFAKMGFALIALFFAYKGGFNFMTESERILESMLGIRARSYFQAAGDATRGVVYGIVFTAIAQGVVAGLGYWMVGLEAPMMLAAITTLFAMVPFATPIFWGSIGLWLLLTGNTIAGIELLLWGTFAISWVDNIVRPVILAKNVKIPFILAFFGVLGGLSAFGFIGLFLGPVILAVAFAVWQEWLETHPDRHAHHHEN
jgi:predicted PurR-regulated permease PerM